MLYADTEEISEVGVLKKTMNDKTYSEIQRRCDKGNQFADLALYHDAITEFSEALRLLPEPRYIWEASTWLHVSIGDMYFQLRDYSNGLDNFMEAQKCPDGLGNPFICARIGECFYELNDMEQAKQYLMQAYMLEGEEIFSDVDPKYFQLIRSYI